MTNLNSIQFTRSPVGGILSSTARSVLSNRFGLLAIERDCV